MSVLPGLFALAGCMTIPLPMCVCFQTYEARLTHIWSPDKLMRKWQKNGVRTLVLVFAVASVWLGGQRVMNYVALVGAVCCATLALIIPPALHVRICKPCGLAFTSDVVIGVVGVLILCVSTEQVLASWK